MQCCSTAVRTNQVKREAAATLQSEPQPSVCSMITKLGQFQYHPQPTRRVAVRVAADALPVREVSTLLSEQGVQVQVKHKGTVVMRPRPREKGEDEDERGGGGFLCH